MSQEGIKQIRIQKEKPKTAHRKRNDEGEAPPPETDTKKVQKKGKEIKEKAGKVVEMIDKALKEAEAVQEELKKGKIKGGVRNVLDDASTEFLRPIPGKARMYPETDLPLLKISRDSINGIKKNLPKLKHEIRDELKKKGLSDELIGLILDGHLDEFEVLLRVYDKDANIIAKMVTLWRSEFASRSKKGFDEIAKILNESVLEKVLESLKDGKINEGDIKEILLKIVNGMSAEDALKIERVNDSALEEQIRAIVSNKPGLKANAYMGLVIQKLDQAVDKRKAMEILQKIVK